MVDKQDFTLSELANLTDTNMVGDGKVIINHICSVDSSSEFGITFITNKKYLKYLDNCKASAVIINADIDLGKYPNINFLISNNPYLTYAKISKIFWLKLNSVNENGISQSAFIEDSSKISDKASVGANVYIGKNVEVLENVLIHPNVTIYDNVKIGPDTIIHSGSVIGSDGFGYVYSNEKYEKIYHFGGVEIGSDVEIGSNCSIDRGSIGNTVIGSGTKLDNLVHVAHNVQIGENSAIAGCCGFAGSSKIGKNFRIGGMSGVLGHLNICDNVEVGPHTLITKNIHKPGEYTGIMPAQKKEDWIRSTIFIKKNGKRRD